MSNTSDYKSLICKEMLQWTFCSLSPVPPELPCGALPLQWAFQWAHGDTLALHEKQEPPPLDQPQSLLLPVLPENTQILPQSYMSQTKLTDDTKGYCTSRLVLLKHWFSIASVWLLYLREVFGRTQDWVRERADPGMTEPQNQPWWSRSVHSLPSGWLQPWRPHH